MEYVVTNEKMRELDRRMIDVIGIPGAVLMENAARSAAEAAIRCNRSGLICILIGPGNNGGDGLACLRILTAEGRDAVGILLAEPENYSGDAKVNYEIAKKLGLPLVETLSTIGEAGVIIDAVFGTGLTRPLEGKILEAVRLANSADAYRIAVDIPSGINGTTGRTEGECFLADETVTVLALKRGLLLTDRLEAVGKLSVARIGLVEKEEMRRLEAEQLIDEAFVKSLLPERKRNTNKGSFGRALIAAGSVNMSGAAVMASRAALRTGAGLARAYVPEAIVPAFACCPEVMVCPDTDKPFDEMLEWCTAVGIGCGMGNDDNRRSKIEAVLAAKKPAVLDADALNSMDGALKTALSSWHIVTPHPAEMSRLTGRGIGEILSDPVRAAQEFAEEHGCTVLLKNAVTVIASPDGRLRYNASGSPALAKGGSGDVLTGIVTALLAQGLSPFDAASAGAFLLGASACKAAELLKTRLTTASDVTDALEGALL